MSIGNIFILIMERIVIHKMLNDGKSISSGQTVQQHGVN